MPIESVSPVRLAPVATVTKNRDARGDVFPGGLRRLWTPKTGLVAGDATKSLSASVSTHQDLKLNLLLS